MPFLDFIPSGVVEISQEDFDWIADRMNTAISGSVSFTGSAIKKYRKLTAQEDEAAWVIRAQMLNNFGHVA